MASPRVHIKATVGLIIVLYALGLIIGFALDYGDIFWLVIFGIMIDGDHLPFGRLWRAFNFGGVGEVRRVWKKYGWFDAGHVNFFHDWPGLAVAVVACVIVWSLPALMAYGIHMVIDGGVIESETSPVAHFLNRRYPEWARYHSEFALAHPEIFKK